MRRKDHIKAGQGSWEERKKGRMKGGKRGVRVQGRVSSYTFLSDQCEISIVHLLFSDQIAIIPVPSSQAVNNLLKVIGLQCPFSSAFVVKSKQFM